MGKLSAADARQNFADLLNRTAYNKERTVITRRGKGVAALVPLEDLKLLEELENMISSEEIRKTLGDPNILTWTDFKKDIGM